MSTGLEARPPKIVLLAAAALIGFVMLAAGLGRLANPPGLDRAVLDAVEVLDLTFTQESDGSVVIANPATGRVIERLAPGDEGFIRTVLRGVTRERSLHAGDPAAPLKLIRHPDDRIALVDTTTGRRIELNAFGWENTADFARLLEPKDRPQ